MASSRVKAIREAISATLLAAQADGKPLFASGTTYYRRTIGPAPAFMMFPEGFNRSKPERSAGSDLAETTHRVQIELYSLCGPNEEDNQNRFDAVVDATVKALDDNHRLNGTCLRSRVTSGSADMWSEGNGKPVYMMMVMVLEADCRQW